MNFLKINLVKGLIQYIPRPLKRLLRKLNLNEIVSPHRLLNKYESELFSKMKWAKEFPKHKNEALSYWRTYRFLDDILEIIKVSDESRLLDVGCGIASVLHFIDKGDKHAIDPLAEDYKKLYQYPDNIKLIQGVAEEMPYQDGYFDVVFCTNVLDHVSEPLSTIKEIDRVLKKQGHLVLTVELIKHSQKRGLHHPYNLDEEVIRKLMDHLNFKVLLKKISPFYGVSSCIRNSKKVAPNNELILVYQKVNN